jgi:hypothetical protein
VAEGYFLSVLVIPATLAAIDEMNGTITVISAVLGTRTPLDHLSPPGQHPERRLLP